MGQVEVADSVRARDRVLVVDDDPNIASVIALVLADDGFDVVVAGGQDLAAVRAEVERLRPDCVLLDGTSGREYGDSWRTAAFLSALEPAIPVVMLTAHSNAVQEARDKTTSRARLANFAAAITKPFELDDLNDAVNQALGKVRVSA